MAARRSPLPWIGALAAAGILGWLVCGSASPPPDLAWIWSLDGSRPTAAKHLMEPYDNPSEALLTKSYRVEPVAANRPGDAPGFRLIPRPGLRDRVLSTVGLGPGYLKSGWLYLPTDRNKNTQSGMYWAYKRQD